MISLAGKNGGLIYPLRILYAMIMACICNINAFPVKIALDMSGMKYKMFSAQKILESSL